MRLAGLAMLAAFAAGGASAQVVSRPVKPKPDVIKPAEDPVKTGVNPVGNDMNRTISPLQSETQQEAEKEARDDRDLAEKQKAAALAAKSGKLAQDNAAIAGQTAEAKEKAAAGMAAANTQLATGVASGAVQAGGAKPKDKTVQPCKDCTPAVKPH